MKFANCGLCLNCLSEHTIKEHILTCVNSADSSDPSNITYKKYYILCYILNLIQNFELDIKPIQPDFLDFIFSIYEHFYLLGIGNTFSSPLLGVDDFCRLLISRIPFPRDTRLNIVPGLDIDDFHDNDVISDLQILFSRAQIFDLENNNGDQTFSQWIRPLPIR